MSTRIQKGAERNETECPVQMGNKSITETNVDPSSGEYPGVGARSQDAGVGSLSYLLIYDRTGTLIEAVTDSRARRDANGEFARDPWGNLRNTIFMMAAKHIRAEFLPTAG